MKKLFFLLALGVLCLNFSGASQVLFHISPGITGSISKLSIEDLGNGKHIIASTSTGLFIIDSNGDLASSFSVPYPITDSVAGDDINSDGMKDVIISTTDQQFPNVMSISSKTGQMLWSFKPEIPSYDSQLMWTTRETKTWDLETAPDSDGDGIKDILVASGNILYLLNGKNGFPIWNFSATNDIWKVKFSDNSAFFGSQDGILYSIDLTGKLIWEVELVPPFLVKDVYQKEIGKVKRSVWDILPNDKNLLVSAEDGNLYQIDKSSGKILNQKVVIEYDEVLLSQYYGANNNHLVQTGPAMTNYFNINLFKIDASTLGVTTFLGRASSGSNSKESGTYTVTTRKIIFFDINSLQEITHSSEIPLTDSKQVFSSNGKFYIPLGKLDDAELFKSIDRFGATNLIEINTTITQNYGGKGTSDSYYTEGFDDSSFVYASNTGDVLLISYTNGVQWSFPRYNHLVTETLDFNGDGVMDFFVKSLKKDNPDDAMDEGKSRIIFLIDGKTMNKVWSYSINYAEYIKSGGIQNIKVINDVNSDGYKELIGFIQESGDWGRGDSFGANTRIILVNGKTGEEIYKKPVVNATYYGSNDAIFTDSTSIDYELERLRRRISSLKEEGASEEEINQAKERKTNLENQVEEIMKRKSEYMINKRILAIDSINDQNEDGIDDLLISCQNEIYVLNSKDGSVIWFKTREPWKYQNVLKSSSSNSVLEWKIMNGTSMLILKVIGDVNADGKPDFVGVSNEKMMLVNSGDEYSIGWTWIPTETNFNSQRVKIIDDINGDGIKEVMISIDSKSSPGSFKIINSKTGIELFSFSREASSIAWGAADLNGDGYKDTLLFKKWSNDGPVLDVVSGRDSTILYTYRGIDDTWPLDQNGYSEIMPASVTSDLNGDGVADMVVAKTAIKQKGAKIVFIDVKNKKEIQTIELDKISDEDGAQWMRFQPAVSVVRIGQESGANKVAISGVFTDDYGEEQSKVVVYDLSTKRVLYDYILPAKSVYSSGKNNLIISGRGGDIYLMDGSWENPIIDPKTDSKVINTLNLKWNPLVNSVFSILIDGQMADETTKGEASLSIKGGEHEVALKTRDSFGNSGYSYIKVSVSRNKIATFLINLLIGLAIIGFIGYNIYVHKRKEVK